MERSSFFNAILDSNGNPDRSWLAEDYARYFASFIGTGVFPNPSTNLQLLEDEGMNVIVSAGMAWINGYFYQNTDELNILLEPADGVLNRIDRIVLRLDFIEREIRTQIKRGVFASDPIAPTLQRDADAYELALADIYVSKGIVSVGQANITDLRLDNELCGIVHGVVDQVDVTTLYNQYTQGFEHKKEEFEQEFMSWFDTLQDVLDENTASNLLNMINSVSNDLVTLDNEVKSHKAESTQQAHLAKNIGLEDVEGKFTATELEGAMSELFTNVSDGKDLVGGAITGVDDSIVIPTDPTFGDLANAIGQISTGKKWASGSLTTTRWNISSSNNTYPNIKSNVLLAEVMGIGFTPGTIIVWLNGSGYFSANTYHNSYVSPNIQLYNYDVITSISPTFSLNGSTKLGSITLEQKLNGFNFKFNILSNNLIDDGRFSIDTSSNEFNWIAFE